MEVKVDLGTWHVLKTHEDSLDGVYAIEFLCLNFIFIEWESLLTSIGAEEIAIKNQKRWSNLHNRKFTQKITSLS